MIIGICCWPFNFHQKHFYCFRFSHYSRFPLRFVFHGSILTAFCVKICFCSLQSELKSNINSSHCYSNGNFKHFKYHVASADDENSFAHNASFSHFRR